MLRSGGSASAVRLVGLRIALGGELVARVFLRGALVGQVERLVRLVERLLAGCSARGALPAPEAEELDERLLAVASQLSGSVEDRLSVANPGYR